MTQPRPPQQSHVLSTLVSGALAGTSVDILFFPLDTIKTRLQTKQGFWKSGGVNGMYRGLGSVVVGSAPSAALFFTSYEMLKMWIPKVWNVKSEAPLVHMSSACGGEIMACLIRVPTEVVKQRQQTGTYGRIHSIQAFRNVILESGVGGLYTGFAITVMREIPFCVIQFPFYEKLKSLVASHQGLSSTAHLPSLWSATCGSIAGATAAAITTPLDVIKTRVMLTRKIMKKSKSTCTSQPRPPPNPFLSTATTIIHEEGWFAFTKGMGPRIIWIGLGGAVFLGVYEAAKQQLDYYFAGPKFE